MICDEVNIYFLAFIQCCPKGFLEYRFFGNVLGKHSLDILMFFMFTQVFESGILVNQLPYMAVLDLLW